jgi:hypothetical protein
LFGHQHDQWITWLQDGIRLASGALQPDPTEAQWLPRYNIIQVSGRIVDGGTHELLIAVFPRRWNSEFSCFMADFTPEREEARRQAYPVSKAPSKA